jgi:hypothetical protein
VTQPKQRKQLESRREDRKKLRAGSERSASLFLIAGVLCLVFTPVAVALFPGIRIAGLYPGLYGLMFLAGSITLRQRIRTYSEEITDLSNELDLLDLTDDTREYRATKLLQVNQFDLRRYYDQILRQGSQIFYVGLLCILIGFAVVGAAFWLVQSTHLSDLSEKIVVASLGVISGVLANFIAVIYLKMFSQTIESVGTFHQRLALRDRLNFGNILAAKIESEPTRDKTLREMAIRLAEAREPDGDPVAIPSSDGEVPVGSSG